MGCRKGRAPHLGRRPHVDLPGRGGHGDLKHGGASPMLDSTFLDTHRVCIGLLPVTAFSIVLLAMIAAFLGMRLYSVLGKRTGHEQETVLPRRDDRVGPLPVRRDDADTPSSSEEGRGRKE